MPASDIIVKGAREHNLRGVDLVLPRNQLICLTGVSGSGKSSFAFDTLFAEGQRRYVESLSTFARQFLGQMPKPDVDLISGLSPSISISQKSSGRNPRSTVGTITEIHDYLRVLYARVGKGFCPGCGNPITAQTRDQIIGSILQLSTGTEFFILAPLVRNQKGEFKDLFVDLLKRGFVRARVDGEIRSLNDTINLDRQMRHHIEVVVDRLKVKPSARGRVAESVELALKTGGGNLVVALIGGSTGSKEVGSTGKSARRKSSRTKPAQLAANRDLIYSADYACTPCGISFAPPAPQMFSFNSPQGMCLDCDGLGRLFTFDPQLLVPDPSLSFKQGAIQTVAEWQALGRWRRHIYNGVAETVERIHELPAGTMLETPWGKLDRKLQEVWLYGSGGQHITFTWRGGSRPMKYGGGFDGIVNELLDKYRTLKSLPKRRQLEKYMDTIHCSTCDGHRLNEQARHIKLESAAEGFAEEPLKSLPEACSLTITEAQRFFTSLQLTETEQFIAGEAIREISNRLGFLVNVGLDYLTLDRSAPTLSGGESQRIRLAGQIGSGLVGVLYILDEPSIGLHNRDNQRLISTLQRLRDQGNTVLVVEHDEDTMRAADHVVDFGPGPGVRGGEVVAAGEPEAVCREPRSVTGQYLSGRQSIATPQGRRQPDENRQLSILGAEHNNLKKIDVSIPLGMFVCVTGVSGSGKSSLVNDILVEALRQELNRGIGTPGKHREIRGLEHLDKLIAIDQSPIGRTPRSNPGTYIKVFDEIRKLYTNLPESKRRGYTPGRFSFNVKAGRCQACDGNGSNKLEMDFLADVWITCPVCNGQRFSRETLQVKFKDNSIADVLDMDVQDALRLFENIPKVYNKLQTLHDVGLDYLKIGQPSPTLSGGEAQRIKLAKELVKKSTGKTLYLLDEPTTGLHFADIQMLLGVLQDFVDKGNTVLVVEHNLDVIKTADWVIDMGPEGGAGGGRVVATGSPEQIVKKRGSYTGQALKSVLQPKPSNGKPGRSGGGKRGVGGRVKLARQIQVRGAAQHNLRSIDCDIDRDALTVFSGPSGSGKSSLAMDTIYAEGQRRYVESLSAYARQFVNQVTKPKVDHVEGLSPAIAIEQKNLGNTPRSTVGTVTEVYDYLRILFSRLGTPYCPDCDLEIGTQTADQIVDKLLEHEEGTKMYLMAPIERADVQDYDALWEEIRSNGFVRVRINDQTYGIDDIPTVDRRSRNQIDIVIDRIAVQSKARSRIAESVEAALSIAGGELRVAIADDSIPEKHWEVRTHSQHLACGRCGRSFERLSPHHFSFNSRLGWCLTCEGRGTQVGANPAALLRDPEMSLEQGAIQMWPAQAMPLASRMLEAFGKATGIPIDVPFSELDARHRRLIFYGTGERWFNVELDSAGSGSGRKKSSKSKRGGSGAGFKFQFKGLYPTLQEASRLSLGMRAKMQTLVDVVECGSCGGSRLRDDSAAVRLNNVTIDRVCRMPLRNLQKELGGWTFSAAEKRVAGEVLREVKNRVQFLNDVGLEYLTLGRAANTLSNGEAQRIRLASQLGSGLCGVLYVLDEPTIGLHPSDNRRLLAALYQLRDLGNTLIVVEHDREVIANADEVCDFGPQAGTQGGQIVAQARPDRLASKRGSVTGPYLSGKKSIAIPRTRRPGLDPVESAHRTPAGSNGRASGKKKPGGGSKKKPLVLANSLEVVGARQNNLKNIDVAIPLETLTVVTGPSGCGKSSLVNDILYCELARRLHYASTARGAHDAIRGMEYINKVISVDQTPLGNSPASNPATYTGVFELIRQLFAQLPDAKVRGYSQRRFSFNVPGGRCETCEGNGQIRIEMHFLPDVWVTCETCQGRRYNEETLGVRFHGHSINEVLEMTCGQAVTLFENIPKIRRILQTLCDVGLDYVQLGQPAPTLSGGEAQRVKLAAELARPDTGQTLYLLDEPTTGLHFDDLTKLLEVLQRLVDVGNTVVLIEHNLDIIKCADWVIDLGPEAGHDGGQVVVAGTPEKVVEHARNYLKQSDSKPNKAPSRKKPSKPVQSLRSHTGEALIPVLEQGTYRDRPTYDPLAELQEQPDDLEITEVGQHSKMPWEIDGRQWHTKDRVDRKGEPVKWDGRILEKVIDRIEAREGFAATDYNSRSVVEIAAERKTRGWFFHAITAETWLLKLKFRCRKYTFKRNELLEKIPLATLNEMEELPIYGNQPRIKVTTRTGPWQEIEFKLYDLKEIDRPEFWEFVDRAAQNFVGNTSDKEFKIDDHMPWTKLGEKWHFMRKGFAPGKKVKWDVEVLEVLFEVLNSVAGNPQTLWNNKQLVHLYVPEQKEPWASVQTKRNDAVWLHLTGPSSVSTLGRIAPFANQPTVRSIGDDRDVIRMAFTRVEELQDDQLLDFLEEHYAAVKGERKGRESMS